MFDQAYNSSLQASCPTSPFTADEHDRIRAAEKKITSDEAAAARMGISVERMLEMRAYAASLKRKYPKWKEARVQRKTAENFKIKLVPNDLPANS